jgi:hypothetical protein
MITRFSPVTPTMLQILDGNVSYNTARRRLLQIKDSIGTEFITIYHVAKYWDIPEAEIIAELLPKKLAKLV